MTTELAMDAVADALREAKKYGLEVEVVVWALMSVGLTNEQIVEAIWSGFYEWVK